MTDLQTWGYLWRAAMTQDPNWPNLQDLSTGNIDPIQGNGTVTHGNMDMAIIHDIVPDIKIDYWWNTYNFAKFGWFAWNDVTPQMPVGWINYNPCYFWDKLGNFNGFTYGMYGGTYAWASTYSMLDVPFNLFQGETFNVPR
jgi:hypothetical protein